MWRVARTIIRGQYANDDCFLKWTGSNVATVAIAKVETDPLNTGGPNDKRYYLLYQAAATPGINCSNGNPDLVTSNGKNGWDTQAEAENVLNYELGQAKVLAENIKKQNEAAVSPSNIAAGVASDIGKDLNAAGKSILSSPFTWVLALPVVGVLLYKVLK